MGVFLADLQPDTLSLKCLHCTQVLSACSVKHHDFVAGTNTQHMAGMVSFRARQDQIDTLALVGRKIKTVHGN
jgi:hypothetical protein